ncbi:MAG: hypothetical protein PHU44_19050 [Syntrophales bacterium]|nr:hypothetical protein [Syntrophales bacterium]MDD5641738.1 hypothetical protein [Syntrophales bacterium]
MILHIHGSQLQNLAYPYAAPGHEFRHQTISYLVVRKMISSMVSFSWICQRPNLPGLKSFFSWGVTRISQLLIQVIAGEVEEGFEVGIAGVLG